MAEVRVVSVLQRTIDGLRPHTGMPEYGSEEGRIARLKAAAEVERKSKMKSLHDEALKAKVQGNQAIEEGQSRHAVREYNYALECAHKVMDLLECERPGPMNGYQLRALERGQKLPKTGPESIEPFCAVVLANRALAFLRLDAFDSALDDANEACRLEPRYLKSWVRRAAALVATNKVDRALAVLEEALDKACHFEAAREQVSNLIVNIRSLGNVLIRRQQDDVPEPYRIPKEPRAKPKTARRKKVKVALELPPEPEGTWRAEAAKDDKDDTESSIDFLRRICGCKAGEPAVAEVEESDFNAFIAEDWHVTHLRGRWRQTMDEVNIVVTLPRRPKASELKVQIRTNRLWVLLQLPGSTGEAREDYETLVDHALAGEVTPAESCWFLEAGSVKEIHFTLAKQARGRDPDGCDKVLARLWDRAFEDDRPINSNYLAMAKGAKARVSSMPLGDVMVSMRREAMLARVEGDYAKAEKLEHFIRGMDQKLGVQLELELPL